MSGKRSTLLAFQLTKKIRGPERRGLQVEAAIVLRDELSPW